MVVRVQHVVAAARKAHQFEAPVGNDFVGIHVGGRAGATLDHIDDELVMELSGHDFIAGLDDGAGVRAADSAQFAVHACCGLLDMCQGPDQIGHVRDLLARNGEILDGTGRLHAPVRIGRNFHGSQKIDFCPGHGCHKACSYLSWKKWPGGGCGFSPGKACTAGNANRYMRHCTPADDYRAQTMFCQSKALVCAPVLLCQACAARPFFQKAAVYGVSSGGGAARHQGRA